MSTMLERVAVIGEVVRRTDCTSFGRTALVKCLFLMKAIKEAPITYRFKLYTYGPFDPQVLSDLNYATAMDVVHSKLVYYSTGYGYRLEPGSALDEVLSERVEIEAKYGNYIDWVVENFGRRPAAELEVDSTVIFLDRACGDPGEVQQIEEVVNKVHEIKPRFPKVYIEERLADLRERGFLKFLA